MKLRNKQTGEIATLTLSTNGEDMIIMGNDMYAHITKLSELKDYEDYEEPKDYWIIDTILHEIRSLPYKNNEEDKRYEQWLEELGLKFETREQAEKAVEKLKIYNKLKQKGFVFSGWYYSTEGQLVILADNHEFSETEPEDLTELFGDKIC